MVFPNDPGSVADEDLVVCGGNRHAQRFFRLIIISREGSGSGPLNGHLYIFCGRRGDLIKVIWYDGHGSCLFSKRLERGRFVWPSSADGKLILSPAQLSMLLEGIDWRALRERGGP